MSEQLTLIQGHLAVRIKNCIVVIGGWHGIGWTRFEPISKEVIWTYNLYTEQWRRHKIQNKNITYSSEGACAAAIGTDIYMFGGSMYDMITKTNDLWKLSMPQGYFKYFKWSKIDFQHDMKLPTPRKDHSGWEYAECLWVFGGYGMPSRFDNTNPLCDHGVFSHRVNNQLICFNPSTKMWTNPQCFGAVPSPRFSHKTAIIKDKVWLYGGKNDLFLSLQDFFEFNMQSCIWTQIESGQTRPQIHGCPSLTAISNRYLILHGGLLLKDESNTWLMDLHSLTWQKHPCDDQPRRGHTCTLGVNKCVIIIGGLSSTQTDYNTSISAFHVMLEPNSLQQIAMKTIYSWEYALPWRSLPQKLIAKLGL